MNKIYDVIAKALLYVAGAGVFFLAGWILRGVKARRASKVANKDIV